MKLIAFSDGLLPISADTKVLQMWTLNQFGWAVFSVILHAKESYI